MSILAGLLLLYLLRDPLYTLIIVLLKLVGIVAGILLVIVGIALLLSGRWVRRMRPWGWTAAAARRGPGQR